MNIADQFIVGLVELGERHNQIHGAEYYKPKARIQTSDKTQPRWTQTQHGNWKNENYASKGYRTAESVYFFGFFGRAWNKEKN
jgi:hypothetical protein